MKNIKKVIVPAIAAIALCISLIAGATYAWFTDTAKSNVNTIKSGKLDVALEMQEGDEWVSAEGKTLSFLKMKEDGTLAADENVLWEPGCTYKLPLLRVVNNGNLALKYRVILSGATGDLKLLEVISFTAEVTKNGVALDPVTGAYGSTILANTLEATTADEQAYDTIALSATMDKEAGNEYMNLAIENIAITVYATQAPVEYDSIDNKYDEKASALETIKDGEEVTLTNGSIGVNPNDIAVKAMGENTVVNIVAGAYDGGEGGDNVCIAAFNKASVNIYNGTFTVGGDANGNGNSTVYAAGGSTVTIYGGFFKSTCTYNGKYYVLNLQNNTGSKIAVYGGTFVNQNPADGDDNEGGTFVAEGYTVVSKKVGNDTWYTVVAQPENKAALTNVFAMGGNIEVNNDIVYGEVEDTVADMVVISKPTTLKLYKKLISPDDMGNNAKNFCALVVDADTTINATEEGGIDAGKNGGYGINVRNGATLTINGGYYYGGGTTVQVQKGTLVINGGFFACEPYSDARYGYKFLINCIDAAWKDGSAKIVITGGTFVNFDPMDSASENPRGNFLGEGYETVKTEQSNGDVWYTVVKA